MANILNRSIIIPVAAALAAFGAGYAVADEAPPVPKRLQVQTPVAQQSGSASNPCGTAAQTAHQAGMRHGGGDMHGKMMEDHQMGAGSAQGMPMGQAGSGAMPMGGGEMKMGPGAMPMAPGAMKPECGGKSGCGKATDSKSGSMAPSPTSSPMPMGHM